MEIFIFHVCNSSMFLSMLKEFSPINTLATTINIYDVVLVVVSLMLRNWFGWCPWWWLFWSLYLVLLLFLCVISMANHVLFLWSFDGVAMFWIPYFWCLWYLWWIRYSSFLICVLMGKKKKKKRVCTRIIGPKNVLLYVLRRVEKK